MKRILVLLVLLCCALPTFAGGRMAQYGVEFVVGDGLTIPGGSCSMWLYNGNQAYWVQDTGLLRCWTLTPGEHFFGKFRRGNALIEIVREHDGEKATKTSLYSVLSITSRE